MEETYERVQESENPMLNFTEDKKIFFRSIFEAKLIPQTNSNVFFFLP